jgi:hypothetical protein
VAQVPQPLLAFGVRFTAGMGHGCSEDQDTGEGGLHMRIVHFLE